MYRSLDYKYVHLINTQTYICYFSSQNKIHSYLFLPYIQLWRTEYDYLLDLSIQLQRIIQLLIMKIGIHIYCSSRVDPFSSGTSLRFTYVSKFTISINETIGRLNKYDKNANERQCAWWCNAQFHIKRTINMCVVHGEESPFKQNRGIHNYEEESPSE